VLFHRGKKERKGKGSGLRFSPGLVNLSHPAEKKKKGEGLYLLRQERGKKGKKGSRADDKGPRTFFPSRRPSTSAEKKKKGQRRHGPTLGTVIPGEKGERLAFITKACTLLIAKPAAREGEEIVFARYYRGRKKKNAGCRPERDD